MTTIRRRAACTGSRRSVSTSRSRFFRSTASTRRGTWSSAVSLSAAKSQRSSRSCRRVSWGSRPAQPRTIGRATKSEAGERTITMTPMVCRQEIKILQVPAARQTPSSAMLPWQLRYMGTVNGSSWTLTFGASMGACRGVAADGSVHRLYGRATSR